MLLHPKDAAVVKTNAFENSVAIEKTVIEDRNLRVGLVEEFAVDDKFGATLPPKFSPPRFGAESDFIGGVATAAVASASLVSMKKLPVFQRQFKWRNRESLADASLCEARFLGPGWQTTARGGAVKKQKGHPRFAGCPSQASGNRLGRFPELKLSISLRDGLTVVAQNKHYGSVTSTTLEQTPVSGLTHLVGDCSGTGRSVVRGATIVCCGITCSCHSAGH